MDFQLEGGLHITYNGTGWSRITMMVTGRAPSLESSALATNINIGNSELWTAQKAI